MEYVFDCDVIGEILIPLENYMEQKISDQKFIDLSKLTEKTFKDFRSILFQGELLRFFLLAKIDTPQNNSEFFDNLFVKFEFDPSCDFNSTVGSDSDINQGYECNVSIPEGDNDSSILTSDLTKLHLIEPFSLHRNSLYKPIQNGKSMSSSNNYQNVNYDIISRRHFIEEKNILIFEIIRNIVIPNNFLNKSLIMKLHLMKKNKIDHLYDGSYNLLDIYSSGVYNEVKEFTILKTLFKEVKVIRPIYISKINQIDILPDYSFLQLKIENITSSINFLDKSLKVSRFLKLTQEEEYLGFGINLLIKDIHILKEETIVLNKSNIHYKKLENILQEKIGFGINNFDFQLLNSEIPIEIKPGEEIVISIKITKPSFNINQKMNNKAMTKEMKPENFQVTSTVGSSGNNQNKVLSNTQFPLQTREDSIDKRASAFERITTQQSIRSLQNPIPISSMQRSATISQITPSSSTLFNPLMTNDKINKTVPLNSYPTIISEGSQTANYDLEDIIKVTMSTPLVLNIVSYKFYDTLFITVPLKWQNEIYRCIKLELEIQDKIKVHEYFNVTLRLKNMSINIMEIELEISDSSTDFINQQDLLDNITSNVKNSDDEIPSILSEIKNKYIGILNSNEEKILDIRFLAVKKGFHNLTSFSLLDKVSGKKFDFVYPNKIYID